MKSLLNLVILFNMLGMVLSSPEEYSKKTDAVKVQPSQIYHSLDVSSPDYEIKDICIFDQRNIDGDIYGDITVKPGIIVTEIYNGDDEIWKAKPNRDLVKLVIIKKKGNYIYVIITKDKTNRLAETHLVITKLSITFSTFKDIQYPLMDYSSNEHDPKYKNLSTKETQTKQTETEKYSSKQGLRAPFQSREYMNELLPNFVTKPRFREMDEEKRNK